MGAKSWFLRDLRKRVSAVDVEVTRNAYLSIARNTTLPAHVRHKAQLALNNYNGGEGRMVSIRNRCNETGRGLGVLGNYGLCRYQFRLKALGGRLPGVQKASW